MADYKEFSYTRKVKARQVNGEPEDIVTRDGKVTVTDGNWIVIQDGSPFVMDAEAFQEMYGNKTEETVEKKPSAPKK